MTAGEIDDPTLLGYLFGGLDDAESERVAAALQVSQQLRKRLNQLRSRLAVDSPAEDWDIDPPAGLVERTLAALTDEGPIAERRLRRGRLRAIGLTPPPEARLTVSKLNSTAYWLELSAIAAAVLICGVIGISHLLNFQELARQQRCAANLAALGLAIQDFAYHRQDQIAPPIDPDGPLAFAGIYAIRLHENALLGSTDQLWCPSDPRAIVDSNWLCSSLPTSRQLIEADEDQRSQWRRSSGGSYAYNLGVQIDDRYQSSRYLSRPTFAILGDSPSIRGGILQWDGHGAGLCNILFEDGSVRLQRRVKLSPWLDDPFLNERGLMQAGLHADDAAMGPSPWGPKSDPRALRLWISR